MNREILFRGKRRDNGKWIYGNFIDWGNHVQVYIFPLLDFATAMDLLTSINVYAKAVIPDTIGQFTGLCDKNGNKIFEGDFVKVTTGLEGYKSTYHSTIHRVTYDVRNCGVAVFYPFDNSDMVEAEVIGNIYDNPELWR